jgi:hypothetical protein
MRDQTAAVAAKTANSLWTRLAAMTSRFEGFFSLVVSIGLLIALYHSGQIVSLLRSLSATLRYASDQHGTGYVAGFGTVVGWWACGLLVLWGASLFVDEGGDPRRRRTAERPQKDFWWTVLYMIAPPLLLAPIFVHPAVDAFRLWPFLSLLGLCLLHAYLLFVHSKQQLDTVSAGAFAIGPAVILALVLHQLPKVGVFVMWLMSLWLFLHPRLQQYRFAIRMALTVGLFVVYACTLLASIEIGGVLRFRFNNDLQFDVNAVLLSVWWLLPSVAVTLLSKLSAGLNRLREAVVLALLCLTLLGTAATWPADVYLPCTLCACAALVLAVARLTSGPSFALVRKAVPIFVLLLLFAGLWRLEPVLDARQEPQQRAASALGRQSTFKDFYLGWLAARGETVTDHGPLIFVAAAGGGARAAAHTALSLAIADDNTSGKFGDRVLGISGVSGGALGVATWLGMRSDGLRPKLVGMPRSNTGFEGRDAQEEFYRSDFVSVVANRMIAHDFPLALLPVQVGSSDRAGVLADAWESQWKHLLAKHDIRPEKNVFRRSLSSIARDPRLPMTIVNTTTAHDGMRAVYSSVGAAFPGARRLDADASLATAVTDSARFAVVSPVGLACADAPTGMNDTRIPAGVCRKGYFPLSVADGGYTDNSGLASINELIDELKQEGDDLKNVFVFILSSDGGAGLARREGTRFTNGNLIAEVLAPGYVLDAARSGHTATFEQLVRGKLPAAHLYNWDLTSFYLATAFMAARKQRPNYGIGWLDSAAGNSDYEKTLNLPPLGWTLDPFTFDGVRIAASSHLGPSVMADCNAYVPAIAHFCRVLMSSRSPK